MDEDNKLDTYKKIISRTIDIFLPGVVVLAGILILGCLLFYWPNVVVCGIITLATLSLVFDH